MTAKDEGRLTWYLAVIMAVLLILLANGCSCVALIGGVCSVDERKCECPHDDICPPPLEADLPLEQKK